jgi:flavin reductase (DIM6/NTAB) family NADH-FMN oxidoreductase RutF
MIFPVPAVVLGVKGDETVHDDLTVVWSFILDGDPPQVGVSVGVKSAINGELQTALGFLLKHREFTLNVLDANYIEPFDRIDMCASAREDKFKRAGLTRLESKSVHAPGIAEAAVVLECSVISTHELPPNRTVFFSEVLRTTVKAGVADREGRLVVASKPYFGMTAGSGEFWTLRECVGHIGQTKGIDHIRY